MHPVIERFGKSIVIVDGGMGTLLQANGLMGGELPELWNNWLIKMRPKVQPVLNELNTMISNVPEEAEPKLYAKK